MCVGVIRWHLKTKHGVGWGGVGGSQLLLGVGGLPSIAHGSPSAPLSNSRLRLFPSRAFHMFVCLFVCLCPHFIVLILVSLVECCCLNGGQSRRECIISFGILFEKKKKLTIVTFGIIPLSVFFFSPKPFQSLLFR